MAETELLYSDLTYQIIGSLFEVYNRIGFGHRESIYQRALAAEFLRRKISYIEQSRSDLVYKDKVVGRYFFDFLIDDKIIIELKVRQYFSKKDIEQLYSYLRSKNLKLGIIAHFKKSGVSYKRVVNLT